MKINFSHISLCLLNSQVEQEWRIFMYHINFNHPIHIHFIGIGGISMSGLVHILLDRGFTVSGSDMRQSALTKELEDSGATVFYSHMPSNITKDIDTVVYTAAISDSNPELVTAKKLNLHILTRAQLLGQLMTNYSTAINVAGTHGKTTTTSMIAELLINADCDPTISVGGILSSINGNIRAGKSDIFLTEACEYTNSFLSFHPTLNVILNVKADHLDFFKDIQDIRHSFHRFAALLPEDGTLIISGDIENYREITDELPCTVITYGSSPDNDYYCTDIHYDELAHPAFCLNRKNGKSETFSLMVPGEHNVHNAMASIVLADLLGIDSRTIQKAFLEFSGTDRRYERKGERNGVSIIDDYAHHPTEITATLRAASHYPHRSLWCVFQPHTYSRTKAFLPEFAEALALADHVVLADIYPARETDDLGISSKDLQEEILRLGADCTYLPTFEEIENFLLENCINGDLLITMGAGDVVKIGESLLQK